MKALAHIEQRVSGQLQLTEALGSAAGPGLGGALLALAGQLGGTRREGHATIFALTLGVALLGAACAHRLRAAPPRPARSDGRP